MHLVVYIDLIFLINVVMDFIILFIMKELLHETTTLQRISIASVTASFGSCVAIVIHLPVILRFLLLYGLVSIIVLHIAFTMKGIRDYVIKMVSFFGVAFFLDGFVHFMYYRLEMEQYFKSLLCNTGLNAISLIYLIAAIGGVILVYPFAALIVNQIRENILLLRKVELRNHDKTIKGTGLMDTGNMLFDPISGEPVIIAEFSWVRELFTVKEQLKLASYMKMNHVRNEGLQPAEGSEEQPMRIRMIPFHSVGEEEGMLVAVRLDSILIGKQSELERRENVLIGLYPGTLSARKTYQLILHNNYFNM